MSAEIPVPPTAKQSQYRQTGVVSTPQCSAWTEASRAAFCTPPEELEGKTMSKLGKGRSAAAARPTGMNISIRGRTHLDTQLVKVSPVVVDGDFGQADDSKLGHTDNGPVPLHF